MAVELPNDIEPGEWPNLKRKVRPPFEPRIRFIRAWNNGFKIGWAAQGWGFGEVTFRRNESDTDWVADTEAMEKEGTRIILAAVADFMKVES